MSVAAGRTIASFFRVERELGAGTFGAVFEAVDVRTSGKVAIKLEPVDAKYPQLVYEARIMQELGACTGIPRLYWFGQDAQHNVLIMQKLAYSVEALRVHLASAAPGPGDAVAGAQHRNDDNDDPKQALPLPWVLFIARQALQRLHDIHVRGFVHRDIKPDNWMVGQDATKAPLLYLIDFGLTKRVVDPTSQRHIPHRTGKSLTGTPRYASLHAHDGEEQSRRDDLEALGYMLVFLAKGALPWQGLGRRHGPGSRAHYRAIAERKRSTDLAALCDGLPSAFAETIAYARRLRFADMPDYGYLEGVWERAVQHARTYAAVGAGPR